MAGEFFVESPGKTPAEAFAAVQGEVWKQDFIVIEDSRDQIRIRIQRRISELEQYLHSTGKRHPLIWFTRYASKRVDELRAIEVREQLTPRYVAELLLTIDDWRVDEPEDDAGCIDLTPHIKGKRKPKRFLFFGRKGTQPLTSGEPGRKVRRSL